MTPSLYQGATGPHQPADWMYFAKWMKQHFIKAKRCQLLKFIDLAWLSKLRPGSHLYHLRNMRNGCWQNYFISMEKYLQICLILIQPVGCFPKYTERFSILLIAKKISRLKCKYLLSCVRQEEQAHFFCLHAARYLFVRQFINLALW